MPRRKKEPTTDETIGILVKLAESNGFDPEILDGEIRSAAEDEAELIYENTKSESLRRQLEFLFFHGYALGRLREIITNKSTDLV